MRANTPLRYFAELNRHLHSRFDVLDECLLLAEARMHMPGFVSPLAATMPRRRLDQAMHDSIHQVILASLLTVHRPLGNMLWRGYALGGL